LRILIISQYFRPENLAINYVVKLLHEKGYDLEVLTGKPNYPSGRFHKGFGFFSRIIYEEDVKIYRLPILPRGRRFKFITLPLNYLSFIISAALLAPFLLYKKNYDFIFVYGTSPILKAIPAILISKIKGVPVILWVQDLWPQSIAASNYYLPSFVLSILEILVDFIYSRVDLIACQSNSFVTEIKSRNKNLNVHYLPNTISKIFLDSENKDPKVSGLLSEFKDSLKLLFTGNIGEAQSIETIIRSAEFVQEAYPDKDIDFIFIGSGSKLGSLKTLVKNKNLDNCHFIGEFPLELMPSFINLSDGLLVSLKNEKIFNLTIPNKIQSYLASGKPILASLNGEGAKVIDDSNSGYTSGSEDYLGLAENILLFSELSEKERRKLGENGKKYFKENFSDEIFISNLKNYFDKITNGRVE